MTLFDFRFGCNDGSVGFLLPESVNQVRTDYCMSIDQLNLYSDCSICSTTCYSPLNCWKLCVCDYIANFYLIFTMSISYILWVMTLCFWFIKFIRIIKFVLTFLIIYLSIVVLFDSWLLIQRHPLSYTFCVLMWIIMWVDEVHSAVWITFSLIPCICLV